MTARRTDTNCRSTRSRESLGASEGATGSKQHYAHLPGVIVPGGARTPEELEGLLEDSPVLWDCHAMAELFVDGAVMVIVGGPPARGGEAIARLAMAAWTGADTYVADPRQIVQARELALIVQEAAVHVARRGADGTWRYAISLLFGEPPTAYAHASPPGTGLDKTKRGAK